MDVSLPQYRARQLPGLLSHAIVVTLLGTNGSDIG